MMMIQHIQFVMRFRLRVERSGMCFITVWPFDLNAKFTRFKKKKKKSI